MSRDIFTVVGTAANPDGEIKVRFANDLVSRTKILIKSNCSAITLFELPEPMDKTAALQWLLTKLDPNSEEAFTAKVRLAERLKDAKKSPPAAASKVRSINDLKAAAAAVVKNAAEEEMC